MKRQGIRHYPGITRRHLDLMLDELKKNDAKIHGNNPWEIDTRRSGVRFRGEWTEKTSTLSVTLTGKDWYVPSQMIWETIENLMSEIRTLSGQELSSGRCPQTG